MARHTAHADQFMATLAEHGPMTIDQAIASWPSQEERRTVILDRLLELSYAGWIIVENNTVKRL